MKRSYKKRRFVRRRTASRKRFAKAVKRVIMKTAEPKVLRYPITARSLFHDVVFYYRINDTANMPGEGIRDYQRIGDQINLKGWRMSLMISQFADRPNVNYRWWFVEVPKGTAYSYGNWFEATINNTQIDDINKDLIKVIRTGYFRPNQAALAVAGGRKYSFARKFWCPRQKKLKYGPLNGGTGHNDNDVYFMLAPYDAAGAAVTDELCTIEGALNCYYRDP